MNKVKVGFFSFTEITDPGQHRAYNEWHQLDHMPEQFPIPGLALGQRWVCTPPCRRARIASDPLVDPAHYMTLYLMTEPVETTLAEFIRLGAELSDLGRFHRHRRAHLGGPFQVIKAYAAPRVLVSPEAIPARPNRGIFVVVQDIIDPAGADDFAQWVDQVHYPDMLGVDGTAGVWSFVSRGGGSGAFAHANPAGRRIAVYYLDGEPLEVVAEMGKRGAEWRAAGRMPDFSKSVRTLFAGPFETITPWKWDWFEGDSE
jgi:hypothetical protein